MEKYEFNLKVEQLKKMVASGDYTTAMKIADSIDWRRVRNVSLLITVSEIYEKNRDYAEAKDIMLYAYEYAPSGRGLLYKLTILAIKEGDVQEAEAYYKEFYSLAGDDPRQHILRYLILKEKKAPIDQLIHSLESYNSTELDERWMYELAELYHEAGRSDECVALCDKLMLMFGIGQYVDKAIELKTQKEGRELTTYQQGLIDNRDMYEEKLRAVQEKYEGETVEEEDYGEEMHGSVTVSEDYENESSEMDDEIAAHIRELEQQEKIKEELKDQPIDVDDKTGTDKTRIYGEVISEDKFKEYDAAGDNAEDNAADSQEDASGDVEGAAIEDGAGEAAADESDSERAVGSVNDDKTLAEGDSDRTATIAGEVTKDAAKEDNKKEVVDNVATNSASEHCIVEGKTADECTKLAIAKLKELHEKTGSTNQAAKIKASKLNLRGLKASLPKLSGKDLIIEEAGDLSADTISELIDILGADSTMTVILADNPMQINLLSKNYPRLMDCFKKNVAASGEIVENVGSIKTEDEGQENTKLEDIKQENTSLEDIKQANAGVKKSTLQSSDKAVQSENAGNKVSKNASAGTASMSHEINNKKPQKEEEMSIDEFAEYAANYAKSIDCAISGKSMLALYERIEIMEEDNIPLTKDNARDLIEQAADRAEKPGLGGKLKGIFSAKYDKDGMLILKEEHFVI